MNADILPDSWWIGIVTSIITFALSIIGYLLMRDRNNLDRAADSEHTTTGAALQAVVDRMTAVEGELHSMNKRIPTFATIEYVGARIAEVRLEMREDRTELLTATARIEDKLDKMLTRCADFHSRGPGEH